LIADQDKIIFISSNFGEKRRLILILKKEKMKAFKMIV